MQIRVGTVYYVYYLPISVLHLLHGKIEHEKKPGQMNSHRYLVLGLKIA